VEGKKKSKKKMHQEEFTPWNYETLPTPSIAMLQEIRTQLDTGGENPFTSKATAKAHAMMRNEGQYLNQLMDVVDQCEDLEDEESLEILFHIIKRLCTFLCTTYCFVFIFIFILLCCDVIFFICVLMGKEGGGTIK